MQGDKDPSGDSCMREGCAVVVVLRRPVSVCTVPKSTSVENLGPSAAIEALSAAILAHPGSLH